MTILNLNDTEKVNAYQSFVREDPRGQVTQDPLWGELKANWGHVYVYHETDGQIDAVLTVLTVEAVPGKLLGYAGRGPIGDVTNIALIKSLLEEALAALPENVFLIRLDPEVAYSDTLNDTYQAILKICMVIYNLGKMLFCTMMVAERVLYQLPMILN